MVGDCLVEEVEGGLFSERKRCCWTRGNGEGRQNEGGRGLLSFDSAYYYERRKKQFSITTKTFESGKQGAGCQQPNRDDRINKMLQE